MVFVTGGIACMAKSCCCNWIVCISVLVVCDQITRPFYLQEASARTLVRLNVEVRSDQFLGGKHTKTP